MQTAVKHTMSVKSENLALQNPEEVEMFELEAILQAALNRFAELVQRNKLQPSPKIAHLLERHCQWVSPASNLNVTKFTNDLSATLNLSYGSNLSLEERQQDILKVCGSLFNVLSLQFNPAQDPVTLTDGQNYFEKVASQLAAMNEERVSTQSTLMRIVAALKIDVRLVQPKALKTKVEERINALVTKSNEDREQLRQMREQILTLKADSLRCQPKDLQTCTTKSLDPHLHAQSQTPQSMGLRRAKADRNIWSRPILPLVDLIESAESDCAPLKRKLSFEDSATKRMRRVVASATHGKPAATDLDELPSAETSTQVDSHINSTRTARYQADSPILS